MPRSRHAESPHHHETPAPPGVATPDAEAHAESDVHYGRRFSETSKLYHEKAAARAHAESAPSAAPAPAGEQPSLEPSPAEASGAPETGVRPERHEGLFEELAAEARESLEFMQHAAGDLRRATEHLGRLPMTALRGISNRWGKLRQA